VRLDFMDNSSLKSWLLPAVVIPALCLAMFSPWSVAGRVLAPLDIVDHLYLPWRGDATQPVLHNHFVSDAVTQYLPYRIASVRSFSEDGYVGWNPYLLGGTALSANTMALMNDWVMQLHRFFGLWKAWHLGLIGRFLVAGFGMVIFLRSRGCGTGVATALGVAYMLNTEFVSWIYHQWALASFSWMPWLLWALYAAREKSHRYLAAAAVFLALALMGATLQHAAFVVIALGCLWLGWMIEGRSGTKQAAGSGSHGENSGESSLRDTVLLMVAGLLSAGLVAFVLEPTIAGYLENLRAGHEREGIGYAFGWSQPLRMALAWPLTFYPFVLGSVQTLDLTKAFVPSGLSYAFFGTIPMVLAIIGLLCVRVPPAAKLLIVAGLVIPLTPLVGVLYQRVSLLWILGGCWSAGAWLSTATDIELKKLRWWGLRIAAVVIILWLAVSVGLLAFREQLEELLLARVSAAAPASQFGIFTDWLQQRASGLLGYLCIWNPWQLLGLGGLLLSLSGISSCKPHASRRVALLTIGVAMQLSVFWWQWTTWSAARDVYADSDLTRLVQKEVGKTGRLAQGPGAPAEIPFPPNTLMPLGVAITGGYDSIHPDGMRSPTGKSWDFPGTTHFLGGVGEEQPADWQAIWSDSQWVLLRNPAPAVGMVTLGSGLPVPLRPADFKRNSMNTMEAVVPAGAIKLELFSNWHRGWKWRDNPAARWNDTSAGTAKGVEVLFNQPVSDAKAIYFHFDPTPPEWVLVVSGLSAMAVLALALSGRSRDEGGEA
jgi:hypothetical protein